MAQTNILLEAGTNELEVVEFYLDEAAAPSVSRRRKCQLLRILSSHLQSTYIIITFL